MAPSARLEQEKPAMNYSLLKQRMIQSSGALCLVRAATRRNRVLAGEAAESQDQQPRNSAASEATDAKRIDPQAVAELKKMTPARLHDASMGVRSGDIPYLRVDRAR